MCTAIQAWEWGGKIFSTTISATCSNCSRDLNPVHCSRVIKTNAKLEFSPENKIHISVAPACKIKIFRGHWLQIIYCSNTEPSIVRQQNSSVDYMTQCPKQFFLPHKPQVWMIFKMVILEFLQLELRFVGNTQVRIFFNKQSLETKLSFNSKSSNCKIITYCAIWYLLKITINLISFPKQLYFSQSSLLATYEVRLKANLRSLLSKNCLQTAFLLFLGFFFLFLFLKQNCGETFFLLTKLPLRK